MGRRYEPQPALGAAIAELRCERAVRQRDLALRAGIDQASLSQIENGHWNPTLANVASICDALGVRVSAVAERAERIGPEGATGRDGRRDGRRADARVSSRARRPA